MAEMQEMKKKRIAVVTIGGTIFMSGAPLAPGEIKLPTLRAPAGRSRTPFPPAHGDFELQPFGRSISLEEIRTEHHPLYNLDSSEIRIKELNQLGEKLAELSNNGDIDAIVVLSGTDKMHKLVTRMAHHLHGLKKPVLFTGAERPLGKRGSNAQRNYEQAIRAACDLSKAKLNQVLLLFGKRPPTNSKRKPPSVGEIYHPLNALKAHATRDDLFHHSYKRVLGTVTWRRGTRLTPLGTQITRQARSSLQATVFTPVKEDLLDVVEIPETKSLGKFGKINQKAQVIALRAEGKGNVIRQALRQLAKRANGRPVIITTEAGAHVDLTAYEPGKAALRKGMLPSGGLIPVTAEIRAEYLAHQMDEINQYVEQHKPRNATPEEFKRKLFAALYLSGAKFTGRDTKKKHEVELGVKITKNDIIINSSIQEALAKAHTAIKEFENGRKPPRGQQQELPFRRS
ncbi:MAG: asparaginase domain-containing protein [Candidatus Micrarchaeota archaeon]|nr:asparaginase domain-containing protein [Candidatus Micrarchaeota archaeon]